GDYAHAMLTFDEILSKGFNAQSFIGGLSSHFRDLIVCKDEAAHTLLHLAPTVALRYQDCAARCSVAFLFEALGVTSACEAAYKQSGNPRLLIEFALMKLCNIVANFAGAASGAPVPVPLPAKGRSAGTAPAPAPAHSQNETEVKRAHPTGLSIKAMMDEARQEPAAETRQVAASVAKPAPGMPELQEAWRALAESEAKMPRLSSAIAQAAPSIQEKEIHFEVGNLAQKEWIDRNCRPRLEAFLQKKLDDSTLRLVVDVKAAEESVRSMYMPSDKAKYLQETSPEYNALKKDFELEIS
ncbi:MAG: hypothetical protein IJ636_02630, partial [Bacteroidales bacterium]|nr:hypothetical protein [Bacteroidales bacterium]